MCFIIISLIAPEREHSCITDTRVYRVTTACAREREVNVYWNVRNSSRHTWRIHKRNIHPTSPLLHKISLYIHIHMYMCVCVCIPCHRGAHANNVCTCVSCYYYYFFFYLSRLFAPTQSVLEGSRSGRIYYIYIWYRGSGSEMAAFKWRPPVLRRYVRTRYIMTTYLHACVCISPYTPGTNWLGN